MAPHLTPSSECSEFFLTPKKQELLWFALTCGLSESWELKELKWVTISIYGAQIDSVPDSPKCYHLYSHIVTSLNTVAVIRPSCPMREATDKLARPLGNRESGGS